VKIRSAVSPTKARIKKIRKKHRQNITWTHRWACVNNVLELHIGAAVVHCRRAWNVGNDEGPSITVGSATVRRLAHPVSLTLDFWTLQNHYASMECGGLLLCKVSSRPDQEFSLDTPIHPDTHRHTHTHRYTYTHTHIYASQVITILQNIVVVVVAGLVQKNSTV